MTTLSLVWDPKPFWNFDLIAEYYHLFLESPTPKLATVQCNYIILVNKIFLFPEVA